MTNKKGITLIALIITIIIMLILAGVAISMLVGENSVIERGEDANVAMEQSNIEDTIKTSYYYDVENAGKLNFGDTQTSIGENLRKAGYTNVDVDGANDGNGGKTFPITVTATGKTGTYTFIVEQNGKTNKDVSGLPGENTPPAIEPEEQELKAQVGPNAWATLRDDGSIIIEGTGSVCNSDEYFLSDARDIREHLVDYKFQQNGLPYYSQYYSETQGTELTDKYIKQLIFVYGLAGVEGLLFPTMEQKGYLEAIEELRDFMKEFPEITNVTISDGITELGDYTFYSSGELTEINIPDSVESIGRSCFLGSNIEKINFGENSKLTNIGMQCFTLAKKLEEINIPEGVEEILDRTFMNCEKLVRVTIPDSVTSIKTGAFSTCKSLTQIIIPQSVESIGIAAFSDCELLKTVTIKNDKSTVTIGEQCFPTTTTVKYEPDV